MLNIVIGYDRNEAVAYHVLAHSIMRRASGPVCITPIYLPQLEHAGIMTRPRDPNQSTDFTYSRFLTPWLTGSGKSIFMDCDMLCLGDVYDLFELHRANGNVDVSVVKHDYIPAHNTKFLDQVNEPYPCKNWSSLMVFNGYRSAVRRLTPDYVNTASAMDLHRFRWSRSPDTDIGSLPAEWNHLVGEYPTNPNAKLIHFTQGGPWFPEYAQCEYADVWWQEWENATSVGKLD